MIYLILSSVLVATLFFVTMLKLTHKNPNTSWLFLEGLAQLGHTRERTWYVTHTLKLWPLYIIVFDEIETLGSINVKVFGKNIYHISYNTYKAAETGGPLFERKWF